MYTKKIFYENPYAKEFEAVVTACEDAPEAGRFYVMLTATAFYPEGGGQPADKGRLSGEGFAMRVLDVREKDGRIMHLTDAPVAVGAAVTGTLDWERRFSLMQQHTGEHIISGLVKRLYGYDNVGFHMSEAGFTTMDINGELTGEQIAELELLANRAVYENAAVISGYPTADELERLDYRSKRALSANIRIVTVEGYDSCACCGLHCRSAGETGIVKIAQAQKYKSGMRFYMLAGMRAFEDYCVKNGDIYALSRLFSAKPGEVLAAAQRCRDENAELKRKAAEYKFAVLKNKAESIPSAWMIEQDLTSDEQRRLCMLLCERLELAAVFSGADGVYRYAVGGANADIIAGRLNAELNGRGGGSKSLVQGTVKADYESLESFLKQHFR